MWITYDKTNQGFMFLKLLITFNLTCTKSKSSKNKNSYDIFEMLHLWFLHLEEEEERNLKHKIDLFGLEN